MALLGMGVFAYGYGVEVSQIEVTAVSLTLPNLNSAFDGYRLVQISDIHLGTWINRERLLAAVELVNRQQPDLVAITGDFVTGGIRADLADLQAGLTQLTARDGTMAVLGNHDYIEDSRSVRKTLRASGVIDLTNAVQRLERDGACLNIAGLDDFWRGIPRLDLVLKRVDPAGAAILLAHEPDYADVTAATRRFDLQISGHSHGGQIVLPLLGAPILPDFGRKYPSGLYRVGEMFQYTNRGLGSSKLQVRINCRPEITVFTLHSPQANGQAG